MGGGAAGGASRAPSRSTVRANQVKHRDSEAERHHRAKMNQQFMELFEHLPDCTDTYRTITKMYILHMASDHIVALHKRVNVLEAAAGLPLTDWKAAHLQHSGSSGMGGGASGSLSRSALAVTSGGDGSVRRSARQAAAGSAAYRGGHRYGDGMYAVGGEAEDDGEEEDDGEDEGGSRAGDARGLASGYASEEEEAVGTGAAGGKGAVYTSGAISITPVTSGATDRKSVV